MSTQALISVDISSSPPYIVASTNLSHSFYKVLVNACRDLEKIYNRRILLQLAVSFLPLPPQPEPFPLVAHLHARPYIHFISLVFSTRVSG